MATARNPGEVYDVAVDVRQTISELWPLVRRDLNRPGSNFTIRGNFVSGGIIDTLRYLQANTHALPCLSP